MIELNLILGVGLIVSLGIIVFLFVKTNKVDDKQSDSIKDLERRLTDLMTIQMKEIRDSQLGDSREMQKQISSFTREATQIRSDLKQIQDKVKDVSSFQEIFKAPKLRGEWGEASLTHILSQHFPKEFYKTQYLFSSGNQVDAVLELPDGKLLPIDAKFPSETFGRMVEASAENKGAFQKQLVADIKIMVDDIALKYILPAENTVDFALMYIPAEAIYYEIVNNIGKEFDLVNYAWSKKVILTSPNTIYLTLRTIQHWFKDTQISRQTQDILKRLNRVQQDAGKLMNSFRRLGSHLKNAISSYDDSEKRLDMFSDKVERLLETKDQKKLKKG